MKKYTGFVVVAMVLALSGVVYAEDSTANVKVISAETLNKFRQNTADLRKQLKVKDMELRGLHAQDTLDTWRAAELEEDIKNIKAKVRSAAASMNLEPCNCL